ncbi:cell division protein FtsZ [Chondromyces apiculatus]|uniref:Cell division protein FtsZ n=1 Tax=Chondromyces apiculatus DSM 436 TaxID=1192034 RepID=A0A017T039_9BACT|nr:cell division protein FtsZ [Chondromyces apiculatus]EYF02382.1 Cell division protein FtsZ [Chondromyces apiculatus DSM 436]
MTFSIEFAPEHAGYEARIKVIGCGGSGGNAVNTMMNFGLEGVEFIVVNTDAQALGASLAPTKMHIGQSVTRGLGAGADPEKGRKAALEDVTRIKEMISGADMVFVTAGMGGGTGTGAAPVIAQLAREEGCLTVGVVTKPFFFEGKQRARRAELGLAMLAEHVDTLITIPNQKLLSLGDEDLSFVEAFRKADEVLYQAIKGISDLITQNGIVNVDFADVKTVMSNMGRALMGTGCAKGQGRARLAAEMAVSSPLLDDISVEGATGVLINIVGGPDMRMKEIEEAATLVQEQAHEDANIIFGATIDESMGDMIKVTVIATGFDHPVVEVPQQFASSSVGRGSAHALSPIAASTAPMSARTSVSAPPMTQRPQSREDVAFPTSRRPAAPPVPSQAGAAGGARDRSSFVPPLDGDWDTPTFQRRGQ